MKRKKPRSGKTAKPAKRTVRRATRRKPKTIGRKGGPTEAKRAKAKSTKRPATRAKRKTRAATKTTKVRKRVIRKAVKETASISVEGEQTAVSAVPITEEVSEVARLERAQAPALPGGKEPGEMPEQAETGLKLLPILLEGDEPTSTPLTGPGQKYALGSVAAGLQAAHEEAVLPEAYGTGKLLLAARDPRWLYAHWDLTPSQQRQYNALSADRHLVVRVYPGAVMERPAREVHVHPESQHWFIHVEHAETQYVAELGYYQPGRQWLSLAFSPPTVTPAEAISTDQTVRFVTIPVHVPLSQLAALAKETVPADLPPMEAAREHALAELVGLHLVQQEGISSAEAGEVVREWREGEVAAGQSVEAAPAGGEVESISSPSGAREARPEGFWFSINAELILYGATEPDASVRIGGRPIQLRPDGTFSCRFALPDGEHMVSLSALSARDDLRQAELRFSRHMDYQGEGSAAPQDQSLEPLEAESP